ncbi:MAG TPA: hypothetical protein VI794_01085 [Patescibacteria group bacterium]|nr:hypothetical protein [Patescibacteria group bacterium]
MNRKPVFLFSVLLVAVIIALAVYLGYSKKENIPSLGDNLSFVSEECNSVPYSLIIGPETYAMGLVYEARLDPDAYSVKEFIHVPDTAICWAAVVSQDGDTGILVYEDFNGDVRTLPTRLDQ